MKTNTFGLSFSNSALHIIHYAGNNGKSDIESAETFPYPFEFHFEDLLNTKNLQEIGKLVKKFKDELNIKKMELAVSLPLYFTYTKKIALPLDAEDEVIKKQVQWELEHYLPGTLSDFKVVRSDSTFSFNNYEESLFICINKNIINNLSKMAESIDTNISKLTADNFSLDSFLRQNNIIDEKKNQIFLKIDDLNIISHLFIDGKYYISFMDNIYPLRNYDFEEKQLKIAKAQSANIKNLCDHLPFTSSNDLEILVYGNSVNESNYKLIEQNFSYSVRKLNKKHYSAINGDEILKFIEAIGTCIS